MNLCELQIELFCRGVEIDPSCDLQDDARGIESTRAGLGSGLEMVLPGRDPVGRDLWLNAPVTESFVAGTPFLLCRNDGYSIKDRRQGRVHPVRLPAAPAWYRRRTTRGVEMQRIGVLQGTYLAIYVGQSCSFWHGTEPRPCRFCTTGLNVGRSEVEHKQVEDVVETAQAAKAESGVTFVHLNTGYQGGSALRRMAPYVRALKERVGVLVGVQAVPEGPLQEYDTLLDLGTDHFSFCYEYHDPEWFERLCPGKHAVIGQRRFFEALEYCQDKMPRGACSGEIIAGNEPVASTLDAIDYITSVGAFPTVCIFRPLAGSAMEDWPAPEPEQMRVVMRHLWNRCRDRAIPIGIAPNIEVSLIVQPADAAYLAKGGWRDRLYGWRLAALRVLARPRFRRRLKPAG